MIEACDKLLLNNLFTGLFFAKKEVVHEPGEKIHGGINLGSTYATFPSNGWREIEGAREPDLLFQHCLTSCHFPCNSAGETRTLIFPDGCALLHAKAFVG
jgi:hypothetical protein